MDRLTPLAVPAQGILARCDAGSVSPAVAIMELLILTEDAELATDLVRGSSRFSCHGALLQLLDTHRAGALSVAEMLQSDMDTPPENATAEEGVAFCRRLFDWSVVQNEAASVALYSLGDAALLASATKEIIDWLLGLGVLQRGRDVLDLGCGIGRITRAMAPIVRSVTGVDISTRMLERARERCAGFANVRLRESSGLDLHGLSTASFDVALAVDTFPYLVQSAISLAETHVAEASRLLRPSGELVVLQFSYRGDAQEDASDMARFAAAHGFLVATSGLRPFTLWNGLAFRLVRRS